MFAEDPLSLVFLACVVFSGGFLLASSLLGVGHLHLGHLGHVGHVGHVAHIAHIGHGGHVAHVSAQAAHGTTAAHGSATASSSPGGALAETFTSLALGALSLYGLLLFLLVFGVVGYLLHGVGHVEGGAAIAFPLAAGFLAAVGVGALLDHLFVASPESELSAESSHYDGRLATVSAAIRPGAIGEVMLVRPNGARQSLSARSAAAVPLAPGTEVVIVGYEQGIATVQTWDGFIADAKVTPLDGTQAPPSAATARSADGNGSAHQ